MIDFQTRIDSLRGGVHADIHNESYYYKPVLKNILYSDVQFNLPASKPSLSGESNIDLLVDMHSGKQNGSIIVVQHVKKFDHFRSRAIQLGAVEVVKDRAIRLFNNTTSLLARTTTDETKQTRLKPSDSEIYQYRSAHKFDRNNITSF
ncbi:unnamed protein product [Rotaria sp. Silwood1]|nr:unnamed protein product [Rotaria sp. Silwood1]